jgi:hypothetical protein
LKFTKDQFGAFIDICDIVSHLCSDIQIVDGKINQKNDSKIYIINVDLTNLGVQDIHNFKMVSAASKLKLMSMMACDDGDIDITENEDYYNIIGQTSSLKTRIPSDDMLTNGYDDIQVVSDDASKIFHIDIPASVIKLIKKATSQSISQSIEVTFNKETSVAEFSMVSTNKNIVLKLMETPYNSEVMNIEDSAKTKINWDCFIGNPSAIAIDMYADNAQDILLFVLAMQVGDNTIKFYQKVRISKA